MYHAKSADDGVEGIVAVLIGLAVAGFIMRHLLALLIIIAVAAIIWGGYVVWANRYNRQCHRFHLTRYKAYFLKRQVNKKLKHLKVHLNLHHNILAEFHARGEILVIFTLPELIKVNHELAAVWKSLSEDDRRRLRYTEQSKKALVEFDGIFELSYRGALEVKDILVTWLIQMKAFTPGERTNDLVQGLKAADDLADRVEELKKIYRNLPF
ncbi:hypothetical protein COT97_00465 [Candidatus Falkowbacteria bacterium CG10_big_fil_rev_8_21_14_0_10_39_11]|uniref:Uncharacterized protein n=1 Tax=Candidatus Falkowbacteria bacterium CG10_big_fil_rev_8_21_14_0_10_39_11 TaxID=1974565 RepID=A0A2H0V6C3_9BACT|nr:MAG: hypothetical protein COT97_00465 [Candidatus Falkowbacteria bacterium CG10_big_fil_rev_8_21_14_0_10_39_11]